MARKAFQNPEILSEITGVPLELVEGLAVMLELAKSTIPVCPEKYEFLANSWLDQFHSSAISWNWLSPSIHVLMHHGSQIIRALPCAPGLFSEEGTEHNNKKVRHNREHHARQSSLEYNLTDVFKRSSRISSPVILKHFNVASSPRHHQAPSPEVLGALQAPDYHLELYDDDLSESESENENESESEPEPMTEDEIEG